MHSHSIDQWAHQHFFLGARHARNERRTWLVVGLTVAMMVGEIVGGSLFGSMALLADGWHMSTHAAALAIAALAYSYARKHAHDPRFAFGTGKLGDLAGFTSAVVLAVVALIIAYESVLRLAHPVPIVYGQAIAIALLGLGINLVCAFLLREDHGHHHHGRDDAADPGHDHDHDHGHVHQHHHRDNNLRAAYFHVLADAVTSVLAIAALLLAWTFRWTWIDPVVGLIGAAVIASWSYTLIRDAGAVLLDMVPDRHAVAEIRRRLEKNGDRVSDLHLWQVGPGHRAAVVSIVTDQPQAPSIYKRRLSGVHGLSHVSIEVECCPHASPEAA